MSLVSVVIPAYNCQRFLGEAIESVFAQTYANIEVIVVEDGSSDGTLDVASKYAGDERYRVYRHDGGVNRGVSETRALGIRHARGEYIAFLDADDVFEPEKIGLQVDAMNRHPSAVLCHSATSVLYEDEKDADVFWWTFSIEEEESEYRLEECDYFLDGNEICNSSVLARADAVRKAFIASRQLFQFEDWLNWIILSTHGTFVFLPRQTVRYRYHSNSATAAILKNDLRRHYSYLEMLFTLATRLDCLPDGERKAHEISRRLEETMVTLMDIYSQKGVAPARLTCRPAFKLDVQRNDPPPKRGVLAKAAGAVRTAWRVPWKTLAWAFAGSACNPE